MDKEVTTALWILTTFILKGVLAGHWSVNLPMNPICGVVGSSVVLPCSYDFPEDSSSKPSVLAEQDASRKEGNTHRVLSEMWCLGSSRCITQSYVFHSAGVFLDPAYSNRVKYLGQPGTKNCSLQISGIKKSDGRAYMFYVITSHPTQKMPPQTGLHLLVAASPDAVTASVSPCEGVTKGESLQLACCSPTAGPSGQYRWLMYHAGNITTKREYLGQVWTMKETQADASGTYVCQVQSAEGWRNSTNITVDVQYPPYNTAVTVLSSEILTEGVVLTCSSDANPPVHSYTWYQGPRCLTPIGLDQTLRADHPTGESEVYCCVATNTLGSHYYNVTLNRGVDGETQLSSKRQIWLIVGTTTVTLLVVVGIVAFALRWRLKESSVSQSYTLTGTTIPLS
ncbi:unnamed protein product [Lota lota]